MKKLWFRAKRYGWGWYPITWQGWLVLLVWLIALIAGQYALLAAMGGPGRPAVTAGVVLYATAMVMALCTICWYTGEKPGWRWGPPKKK